MNRAAILANLKPLPALANRPLILPAPTIAEGLDVLRARLIGAAS